MESYQKRKTFRRQIWKAYVTKACNDEVLKKSKDEKHIKQIIGIIYGEGLKNAYEAKDGLYQHYNKLFVAATRDFPRDHTDDLRLPMNNTLNRTQRKDSGRLLSQQP